MDKLLRSRAFLVLGFWSVGGVAGWFSWQPDRWASSAHPAPLITDAEQRRAVQEAARGDAADRPALLRRVAEEENGESLAALVLQEAIDADPTTADPVLAAFHEAFPNSPQSPVWEFSLRLKQGDVEEAVRVYRNGEAAQRHNPAARQALMFTFAERAIDAGRPIEALAEIDRADAGLAFEALASKLAARREQGDAAAGPLLRAWVAAYEFRVSSSPSTHYYAGLAAEADGDDDAAASHYAEGLSRLKDVPDAELSVNAPFSTTDAASPRESRDRIQRRWAGLLLRRGNWPPAFDLHPMASETFDWLALTLESAGRIDELRRLVDRQRSQSPNDPILPHWQGVVHWQLGEYAEAAALLDQHRKSPEASPRAIQTADRRFRALIRLGRIDEARAMLSPPQSPVWPDEDVWEMIATAHEGDDDALEHLLAEYAAAGRDHLAKAHADPDLGPMLTSPRFANVRRLQSSAPF